MNALDKIKLLKEDLEKSIVTRDKECRQCFHEELVILRLKEIMKCMEE